MLQKGALLGKRQRGKRKRAAEAVPPFQKKGVGANGYRRKRNLSGIF